MKPLTREWVEKAENDRISLHREIRARKNPNYDAACFFSQQCAEKYIKARLIEADIYFKKVRLLTDFAVEFRYPGAPADLETAKLALKICKSFRAAARFSLGLDG